MYITYMSAPTDRSISEARRDLAAVVDAARTTREPVYLSRRGRRVAAIVSSEELARLQGLAEDMADILDAEAARQEMRETGSEPIPWAEAKADLGLA
jgi:prevent-host-death family protein